MAEEILEEILLRELSLRMFPARPRIMQKKSIRSLELEDIDNDMQVSEG